MNATSPAKVKLTKLDRQKRFRSKLSLIWRNKWLYLILLPVIAFFLIFKYAPMYGIIIAFQDYNIFKGPFESEFWGLTTFRKVFGDSNFWSAIKNTLALNLITLAATFPITILVALMLNEVLSTKFKKLTQSVLYLPHFISWVVVAGIATNMFTQNGGTINLILSKYGFSEIPFLSDEKWWTFTYVLLQAWKEVGWGTIIYLAALTNVDESLYESAYLDGATNLQRIWFITLPLIKSVVVTMLILQISRMMNIGLDAPLLLGNDKVMGVSEVISTYIYRIGIVKAKYSDATAIGLFQSVVNISILLLADRFAKAIGEEGII